MFKLDPVQYILLAAIIFFIFRAAKQLISKKIHLQDFVMWLVFWVGVSLIVIYPKSTQVVADMVGIGRGADLVVYLGMLGLYYFFYLVVVKVKQLDEKITTLGRQVAINGVKNTTVEEKNK